MHSSKNGKIKLYTVELVPAGQYINHNTTCIGIIKNWSADESSSLLCLVSVHGFGLHDVRAAYVLRIRTYVRVTAIGLSVPTCKEIYSSSMVNYQTTFLLIMVVH